MDLARIVTEGNFVHEYRRFVQAELDARGWKPAELARRSGLHRQLVWKILHDERPTLGQMPDESTMEGIAHGFGIPVDRVRTAAARSLRGYEDDGAPLVADLREVSIDVLLTEIRRRVVAVTPASVGGSTKRPAAARPARGARGGGRQHRGGDESGPDGDAVLSRDEP